MGIIINFDETNTDLECINNIVRKCTIDTFVKTNWYGARGFIAGVEDGTTDIVILFREDQVPVENANQYVVSFVDDLKTSFNNADFELIEERASESGEFTSITFKSHLFKLRKK